MSGANLFEKIIEKTDDFVIWFYDRWSFFLILIIILLSGFILGVAATYTDAPKREIADGQNTVFKTITSAVINTPSPEIDSPYDWISEEQIHVYDDRIVIDLADAQWATFTDTNSMDPVIDIGANAIEIIPKTEEDIHVGDIVSYESEYASGVIIHRVVEIGEDSSGWYCRTKGDNNRDADPGKIRFSQIQRLVVGIIY